MVLCRGVCLTGNLIDEGQRTKQGNTYPDHVLEELAIRKFLGKAIAARIGSTVWELEGPMPILNRSNKLVCMSKSSILPVQGAVQSEALR